MNNLTRVSIPGYQSEKDCLMHTVTDSGSSHVSWNTPEGVIIGYENIPDNYPSCALYTYENIDEYKESLKNIGSWIEKEFVQSWDESSLGSLEDFIEELGE